MLRRLFGGALAAFLILSDRAAFAVLAIAVIGIVKLLAHAPAAPDAAPVIRVKL